MVNRATFCAQLCKHSDVIKIDVQCMVEGDVALECLYLDVDSEREAIGDNCRQLESINLGRCPRVDDAGMMSLVYGYENVIALANNCLHLRSLNLYGCESIMDRAMYALAHSRVKNKDEVLWELVRTRGEEEGLMNLNISFCKAVCKANLYDDDVEDLEMLLEAYFMQLDGTRNKILSVHEYIDDTEDYVNIQLDNQHNELIQLQLTLTIAPFAIAFETLVAGLFGMKSRVICIIEKAYSSLSLEPLQSRLSCFF
ncbi:putative magnesium transporter MRS2 [Helianthus annuus]|uniref:Magnesium transporter MRS2 n=1 Tax=Helianthus annuus TaxID=4232 RepID=A0A251TUD6_HELAN|nr:putative magnesium transporter MRS2 [Helianthus annuus]KAJ0451381.1 putative magnesium transporter MRS2 [Helianthus annuus]KAJ0455872.1 putative magnesium transporter MRS2 [Helianthus annuus]KAJ0473253.1 putative magnesium transporter MRS2 [Helianthus annuus]KAJ0648844.1 putative magnesium transporter MRS2 [Helianthus annuus]